MVDKFNAFEKKYDKKFEELEKLLRKERNIEEEEGLKVVSKKIGNFENSWDIKFEKL